MWKRFGAEGPDVLLLQLKRKIKEFRKTFSYFDCLGSEPKPPAGSPDPELQPHKTNRTDGPTVRTTRHANNKDSKPKLLV